MLNYIGMNNYYMPYYGGFMRPSPVDSFWAGFFSVLRFKNFTDNILNFSKKNNYNLYSFNYSRAYNSYPHYDYSYPSYSYEYRTDCNCIQKKYDYSVNNPFYKSYKTFLNTTSKVGNSQTTSKDKKIQNTGYYSTVNDALRLAEEELAKGVKETSENNSADIKKYKNGAVNNQPWCASFASWLYGAGQNKKSPFGYSASSLTIAGKAKEAGYFASKNSGYTPKPGDLMILKYAPPSKQKGGHIGIVKEVFADGSFTTIEGNYHNKISKVDRSMSTDYLYGFVRMDDWLKNA